MPSDNVSVIKSSFSLSSLQSSSRHRLEKQQQQLLNRPYHSLTKKLRYLTREQQQSPCGSCDGLRDTNEDECWNSLVAGYNYLMDSNLIESCKEARQDLTLSPSIDWTYDQLKQQFVYLDAWLDSMQVAIYAKDEMNEMDRKLRLVHIDEMRCKNYQRKNYVKQSARLICQYPELKQEISWRVNQLIAKWDRLVQTVSPKRSKRDCIDVFIDVKRELHCLRNWIKMTEDKLEPLDFRATWSLSQLKVKAKEYEAIQKDVQSRSKIVLSVVKLCENLSSGTDKNNTSSCSSELGSLSDSPSETDLSKSDNCSKGELQILRLAHHWQHRWQLLYLKCIEWQCYIENLLQRFEDENSDFTDNVDDSDDEQPSLKHRRLNDSFGVDIPDAVINSSNYKDECCFKRDDEMMDISTSDNAVVVVPPMDHDDDVEMRDASDSVDRMNDTYKISADELAALPPDMFKSLLLSDASLFNKSCKIAPNCGTYYYKHKDTDSEQEITKRNFETSGGKFSEDSSEEEWTYTSIKLNGTSVALDDNSKSRQDHPNNATDISENDGDLNESSNDNVRRIDTDDIEKDSSDTCTNSVSDRMFRTMTLRSDEDESIQKLVEKVEELVKEKSSPKKFSSNIATRKHAGKPPSGSGSNLGNGSNSGISPLKHKQNDLVRKWLKTCHQDSSLETSSVLIGDSCDASGEYTTEDDDQCDRRSSCDQTLTVVDSSHDNGLNVSTSAIEQFNNDQPKITLRAKSGSRKTPRPFSTSEILTPRRSRLASQFSASESALNKIVVLKDIMTQSNLSSSTVEESTTTQTLEGSGCSSNSLRRRKFKHRRRNTICRKNHSGSADSLSSLVRRIDVHTSPRSPLRLNNHHNHNYHNTTNISNTNNRWIKSESLLSDNNNVVSRKYSSVDRDAGILSEPPICVPNSSCSTDRDDDNDSVNEQRTSSKRNLMPEKLFSAPAFRLGPSRGAVTQRDSTSPIIDTASAEEQHSSFSEQAWDSYQEKYMSEAYSEEPIDSERVKTLLEFGDDYQKFIGSQSDCANLRRFNGSSVTGTEDSSALDSDSDLDVIRPFIFRSQSQLTYCEHVFAKRLNKPNVILTESEINSLKGTCRKNIHCLRVLLDNIERDSMALSSQQIQEIKRLLERWEVIEESTDNREKCFELQRYIAILGEQLRNIAYKMPDMTTNLEDKIQLQDNICILKGELTNLKEKKTLVTNYNMIAHRLLQNSESPLLSLKEDVTELYRIWEETYQKVSQQLSSLQETLSMWQHFELHLAELKTALHDDEHTLNMLETVIQKGSYSSEVVNSVRDVVAKNLSIEKKDSSSTKVGNNENSMLMEAVINAYNQNIAGGIARSVNNNNNNNNNLVPFGVEGSFSDSGISDSGSEQDLSERERRLATLKKLARHLESVLAPGSVALVNIMKRIDETEDELRVLQQTCKTLIAKAGGVDDAICQISDKNDIGISSKRSNQTEDDVSSQSIDGKRKKGSLFWRIVKAALPFHMAIAVLICVACLLEPHCCDSLNTFGFSFLPQLRYMSGSPPPT